MRSLKWILLIVAALAGACFLLCVGMSHGHINELLVVTVRIVDRDDGRPLEGAIVVTVRHRDALGRNYFERNLEDAMDRIGSEDAWTPGRVAAARTTSEPITTVRSSAYVTRYWLGPVEVRKSVFIPQVLLVDHPRLGRTVIRIDPQPPSPGSEPRTWRVDLGTIRVPQ